MRTSIAHHDDVDLAYEVFDDRGTEPLLLIGGLALPTVAWPEGFCTSLADRGFQVARFDNRDSGRSSRLAGKPQYTLADMASDTIAVLDELNWPSAHLVGVSLGGMIAQVMAVHHAERVRSLTSISSAPGVGLRISRPRLRTVFKLLALNRRPINNREASGDYWVTLGQTSGSTGYPLDEQWAREIGMRIFDDYGAEPDAGRRQIAAFTASGDRWRELADVRVPTLVVHGEADPMQSVRAGRATAAAISGSRLVTYPGMGHDLPRELWPSIADEIRALTDRDRANEPAS